MAGPTDWVSFQDYLGLNEDEMRQAVADSQASVDEWTDDQQNALRQAGVQSGGTGTAIQQTAGYGEFLDMRDKAQAAYTKAQSGIAPTMEERAMMEALGLDVEMYDASGLANEVRAKARDAYGRQLDADSMWEAKQREEELARMENEEKGRQARGGLSVEDFARQTAIERGIDSSSTANRKGTPGFGVTDNSAGPAFGDHDGLLRSKQVVGKDGVRRVVRGPLYGSGLGEMWDANAPGSREALSARLGYGSLGASQSDPYWETRRKEAAKQYEKNKEAYANKPSAAAQKRKAWEDAWAQDDLTWEY